MLRELSLSLKWSLVVDCTLLRSLSVLFCPPPPLPSLPGRSRSCQLYFEGVKQRWLEMFPPLKEQAESWRMHAVLTGSAPDSTGAENRPRDGKSWQPAAKSSERETNTESWLSDLSEFSDLMQVSWPQDAGNHRAAALDGDAKTCAVFVAQKQKRSWWAKGTL